MSVSVKYLCIVSGFLSNAALCYIIRTQNETSVRRRVFRLYILVHPLLHTNRDAFLPRVSLVLELLVPPLSFFLSLPHRTLLSSDLRLYVPVPQYLRGSGRFHSDLTTSYW